jgi:hypothetical protein
MRARQTSQIHLTNRPNSFPLYVGNEISQDHSQHGATV